jgi:putative endonuclease
MIRIHVYYVYIVTNKHHTVLYTGVTNDLLRRCNEHKQKQIAGFTKKYNVDHLVYFEMFDYIETAIAREKQIKGYSRNKKEHLISAFNPGWIDLYVDGKIASPGNDHSKMGDSSLRSE